MEGMSRQSIAKPGSVRVSLLGCDNYRKLPKTKLLKTNHNPILSPNPTLTPNHKP